MESADPEIPARPTRQRRRAVLSCLECRRRKIKCDHNRPCTSCVQRRTTCSYQRCATDVSSRQNRLQTVSSQTELPPRTLPATNRDVSGRSQITAETPSTVSRSLFASGRLKSSKRGPASTDEVSREVPTPSQDAGAPSQQDSTTCVASRDNNPTPPSSERQCPKVTGKHQSLTQEWQVVLNKSRDLGRNRSTGTAREFSAIIGCYAEMTGKESGNTAFKEEHVAGMVSECATLLEQCKETAKEIKVRRPPRRLHSLDTGTGLPSRQVADCMVSLYLALFESTHRILHVPSFWSDYRRFWDEPGHCPPDLRLQVLLVMTIGSSLYDHGSQGETLNNIQLAQQRIHEAELWLAGPLEKDRLSISGLQIYCLTILARQIFSIGGDTIWVSMGTLIHRAMQLGLHRDPGNLPPMKLLQAEIRRRLWATIVDLTVQAALDARMPPRISLDEFDTMVPANVNDDDMDEATDAVEARSSDALTSSSVQISLLESLPLRLSIVQALSSMKKELTYEGVLELCSKLTNAIHSVQRAMERWDGPDPLHKTMLDYLVRRFMIPLNYSFSHQARVNHLCHYSLRVSVDTALFILHSIDSDAHFSMLMGTGGGLFRECLRGMSSVVALDLLGLIYEQRLDGTLRSSSGYRALVEDAVRRLVALSERRIRLGETNVKSHMFLGMVLAQVAAVERDAQVEVEIARAGRDSLRFCRELLSERVGAGSQGVAGLEMDMNWWQGLDEYGLDVDWDLSQFI